LYGLKCYQKQQTHQSLAKSEAMGSILLSSSTTYVRHPTTVSAAWQALPAPPKNIGDLNPANVPALLHIQLPMMGYNLAP
jgi:hypothetical protein